MMPEINLKNSKNCPQASNDNIHIIEIGYIQFSLVDHNLL